jgi:DNA repair protein SbcD/Mre11
MKILHTSDWHVGKVLKGASRHEEHVAVLAELVQIAKAESPDLVLVAGDLFDSAAPIPSSTRLVTATLSALRRTGAEVVAIAGNHDNGAALEALRPWAQAAGITLRGTIRSRQENLISGDGWRLVALPFLSQRYAVRATELFELSAAEATQTYADHLSRLIDALTSDFTADGTIKLHGDSVRFTGSATVSLVDPPVQRDQTVEIIADKKKK